MVGISSWFMFDIPMLAFQIGSQYYYSPLLPIKIPVLLLISAKLNHLAAGSFPIPPSGSSITLRIGVIPLLLIQSYNSAPPWVLLPFMIAAYR